MRVYTLHFRPGALSPDRDVVLVKEGFSWPAFFLTALWALWHRLWLCAAFLIAGVLVIETGLALLDAPASLTMVASLGISGLAGAFGNDLRRARLAHRGYIEAGPVAAPDREAALRRYFDLHPDRIGGHGRASLA